MFRTVPLSIIRSLFTYTQQWYIWYRFVDSFRARPGWNPVPSWICSKALYKPVWYIPLLSVQRINSWWWTEELSETCRVSCQNKFGAQFHLGPTRKLSANLYDIYHCWVYSEWIPDDGQRNCPKHVEFHAKINLELSSVLALLESCLQTCVT
jgi:hypothetical protein